MAPVVTWATVKAATMGFAAVTDPIETTVSPKKICTKVTTPKVIAAGLSVGCSGISVTSTTNFRMNMVTTRAPRICVITLIDPYRNAAPSATWITTTTSVFLATPRSDGHPWSCSNTGSHRQLPDVPTPIATTTDNNRGARKACAMQVIGDAGAAHTPNPHSAATAANAIHPNPRSQLRFSANISHPT